MDPDLKHCPHCDLDLPGSQFYKDSKTKDGRTVYCKAYYSAYYRANSTRQKRTSKNAHLKRRYGITRAEYDALIARGCSICGTKASGRIVLDHCHATNAVRAPLCNGCNVALGAAADDPARLRALADYLERHAAA